MSFLWRSVGNILSPGGKRARLSILIFHRVLAKRDPLFPEETDAASFNWQLEALKKSFNILPLDDAVQRLREGSLPARAAAITFDDGYRDNAEVALPILQQHQVSATFFIATGFLDGGCMWNDVVIETLRRTKLENLDLSLLGLSRYALMDTHSRRLALNDAIGKLKYLPPPERLLRAQEISQLAGVSPPEDMMMTSMQVRALHEGGMGIGGHTMHHPILASLDKQSAEDEILGGKKRLEEIIQAPVNLFAYPNGKPGVDYTAEHVSMVKSLGFDAAFSTAWGSADCFSDTYQLPRFTPWDQSPLKFTLRLMHNLTRRSVTQV